MLFVFALSLEQRQLYREAGPFSRPAFDIDFTAMVSDYTVGDRESQTGAGAACCEEGIEYFSQLLLTDAD